MKRVTVVLGLAALLLALPTASVYADASRRVVKSSGGIAAGCSSDPVSVPGPNSFVLLASGIAVLGGVAILGRKRFVKS